MSELPIDPHEVHHPFLQHHFEDMGQQHEASTLGMWVFLATEILFFGGMLMAYSIYRVLYPAAWAAGSHHQNLLLGTINTVVLLASSLTMALSVLFAQTNRRIATIVSLVLTLILGTAFLAIKGFEYHAHFEEGLFPGAMYHNAEPLAARVQLFMVFYFGLTACTRSTWSSGPDCSSGSSGEPGATTSVASITARWRSWDSTGTSSI